MLEIYRVMLSDRKYGLNMSLLATRVLPVLIPQVSQRLWAKEYFPPANSLKYWSQNVPSLCNVAVYLNFRVFVVIYIIYYVKICKAGATAVSGAGGRIPVADGLL